MDWADAHHQATGAWPNAKSGQIKGTDETWSVIAAAIQLGNRGLPRGSTLKKILAEHRGVRTDLTIQQILDWADSHHDTTAEWPTANSETIEGTGETWSGINSALKNGSRGLESGSSLAKLLTEHRGKRNKADLPDLTIEQILDWADAHREATGSWPNSNSRQVPNADETWLGIDSALRSGLRGLPSGSSLARLLAEHRGKRNIHDLPELTIQQILDWADAHFEASGKWPNRNSGQIQGTDETWSRIRGALINGLRGLSGGTTLAKVLAEHRSIRNMHDLSPLTIQQILVWVDAHQTRTGDWPNQKSGQVTDADETWAAIN